MSGNLTVVLPGACRFLVRPPSDTVAPYYPSSPIIHHHAHGCWCMDEHQVMDDDSVFVTLWILQWAVWNSWRVLSPELRDSWSARMDVYRTFSRPHVDRAFAEWDLPSIGTSFMPSSRATLPIEWFWRSLEGARDLAHCGQWEHATQFVVRRESPRGPGWKGALRPFSVGDDNMSRYRVDSVVAARSTATMEKQLLETNVGEIPILLGLSPEEFRRIYGVSERRATIGRGNLQ